MKKIINNKVYDTETAQEMGSWANTWDTRDFHRVAETLYRKRTGEYFLHGEGGPMTQYARTVGQNEWSSGERIMPLTLSEAKAWAEEHLDGDEYETIFGIPDEDAGTVQLGVYVAADVAAMTRERAAAAGMSLSAYVESVLRRAVNE